ncbi:hypothetical protein FHS61_003034 [Altererythrobacter atlanticus]|uniref:Uncharacterized protein n=1 Tax=Croceibacterium atlanticum TaxID=1267766 RepID=A0A0F7KST6_9SPHN|nr:hypothetical protein [Croceibacterium atlanticum]AKH42201.1 hypothetical protein WYH_01155 [Croceibacterium atlanticum]MBB5733987.1 hypothetical protein [Croceibacterium atlanticum]
MYPEPENIWQSLEYSGLGTSIAESAWMFPTIETIHVIALVTVVGTIAIMDLRMLGWAGTKSSITQMSNDTLPWTWGAFVLAAITGGLLFVSKASSYVINPYFLWKMFVLVLAGVNMMYFHFITYKTVHEWDVHGTGQVPVMTKVAGILSLTFWILVVFFGRAIGFTLGIFY